MFLVPLAIDRWTRGEHAGAVPGATYGVAVAALINLPFLIMNPSGWLATYRFHSARIPNYDSVWGLGFATLAPKALDILTATLLAISGALMLGVRASASDPRGDLSLPLGLRSTGGVVPALEQGGLTAVRAVAAAVPRRAARQRAVVGGICHR